MIRAYISDAQYGASIAISLVLTGDQDQPRRVLHFESLGEDHELGLAQRWSDLGPDCTARPTLILGHDMAIAVMQALNTHYSGVDDARMLRQDYDAERKRVDKLTDVLAEVVRGSTHG